MNDLFRDLREREFGRLDATGQVYLDYTGSGLYAESQVRAHSEMLLGSVLGNPHSRNPTSQAATDLVEEARRRVLEFFDADRDEYDVVFTLNASHSLKLVGEAFPFAEGSRLVLTADNHNSVNGIREFARCRGADVRYVPLNEEMRIDDLESHLAGADPGASHLFVFPAQSNFSGVKHPLRWIETAREMGYTVVLDAAAFVPTSRLSLRATRPDFACVSFYKMFGYPTGVGALLARCDALRALHRPWHGGGTVRFVSAASEITLPHDRARGFEDGTLNFLALAALPWGLDFLERVGMERVNAHVMKRTGELLSALGEMRHANGAPMVRVYGPRGTEGRGGTVAFNLLDPDGEVVDFREVERRANEAAVSIRTGYFCNPGAAETAFGHSGDEVTRCAGGNAVDWSLQRFSVCLSDKPVGGVRVSVGIATNRADLDCLLGVLGTFRDQPRPRQAEPAAAAAG